MFLQQAAEFHQAWGLQPKRVDSLQAVVDDLANDTAALSRVRIVTHAVDRGVLMPLFTGEGKATTLTTARLGGAMCAASPIAELDGPCNGPPPR